MKIKRIAVLLVFLLFAISIPLLASVNEDSPEYQEEVQIRRPMPGDSDASDSDNEDDDFIPDDDYTPTQGDTVAVGHVNVNINAYGITDITIPGHPTVNAMAFATDYDIEFFVTPPAGTHFTTETALVVSDGIEITFGPVVRGCGRLFFVKSLLLSDSTDDSDDYGADAVQTVDIIFYPGGGLLPLGESGSMMGPVGMLVPHGPAPYPPFGYTFAGWSHNGIHVTFPFNAAASMTLEAVYVRLVPGDAAGTTFTLTYSPAGGVMPAGEPLTRILPVNTLLSTLPTPTRYGYMFTGWMTGNNLAELPIMVTGNLELTAAWTRINPTQNSGSTQTVAAHNNTSSQAASDTYAAIFNPGPGVFSGTETGLRVGAYNSNIYSIPVPTRSGYTFGGWLLPDGNTLHGILNLRGDMLLTAIWNVDPNAAPTPTPTSTPAPGSSGQSSSLTNPDTSPMTISFMIFVTVAMAGLSVLGITKINRRHMAAAEEYRSKIARYNREKRIADMMDE